MATDLTNLSARFTVALSATVQKAIALSTPEARMSVRRVLNLTFGTGAGQADLVWWDRRTLTKDTYEDLDLTGGLIHAFGHTLALTNIKVIMVINRSDQALGEHEATDATIVIGLADSHPWLGPLSTALNLRAGGAFACDCGNADGWNIDEGMSDMLRIRNLDADDEALYDIVLIGESA